MSDYTTTGNPLAQTRSISSSIRNEFLAIATAVNSKSDNSGDTYTGTHDFTGATINVETLAYGTTGTYAVSWDAMNAAVFAAANLPAQTGNGGKSLRTDGTTPSWAYPHITTINATVTANTTLTESYIYVPVQMATLGQSITLPSAIALQLGGPQYVIDNTQGSYSAGVRNSAGVLLGAVAPGGEALLSLKDNSTTAGVWSITGTNLEPGLITIDSTLSSAYATTILAPFVVLDDNTSIHFLVQTSGFAALAVDNAGKVVGSPITVSNAANDVPLQAFKVSATTAIVFYGDGTTTGKAVVLTLSGTTLVAGTAATSVLLGANWGGEDFVSAPKIVQLSPTLYVASVSDINTIQAVAIAVSGTTVTIGSAATVASTSNVANTTTTYALTATTALVLYLAGGSPYNIWAAVVSVSGTTCTPGTPVISTPLHTSGSPPISCLLSATKAVIATNNNTTTCQAQALTISGTTVAWGAVLTVEASVTGFNTAAATYTGNAATRYNPHLSPTSANAAMLWYMDSNSVGRVVMLSESGGTLTAGTKVYKSFASAASGSTGFGAIRAQGTSDFIAVVQYGVANGWRNLLVPHKISGTTITYGNSQALPELSPSSLATAIPVARLSQGDYVVMGANAQALPVFRTNGDAVKRRGNIPLPNLSGPAIYPIPVVSSNRLVLLGAAQGAAGTGTTAALLRLLTIEIAS